MRVLTANQIRKVEDIAFQKYFTEMELMKFAGEKCSQKIIKTYADDLKSKNVFVVCGNGKNAGDGFIIAKKLFEFGANVEIVFADKMPTISEPVFYFENAKKSNVKYTNFTNNCFENADYIVDCVFGIGFYGEVKEPFVSVFKEINNSMGTVIAIDTPSGVNSTDGTADKNAVVADLTIAISTLKYAHILPPSNEYCGKTVVVNIGIPEDCYTEDYVNTITKQVVKSCFKKRKKNCNKGDFGHLLNLCGCEKMPGAAVISAKGAIKTGVGLLKCAFPKSAYSAITPHMVEPLFIPMCENSEKTFSMGALNDIFDELKWASCVLIGCGMGLNDDTTVITSQVLTESKCPIVVDADGINAISSNIEMIKDINSQIIITPHPGEMSRLVDKPISFVQENRISVAKEFAKKNSLVVVLKGANTIVTDGNEVFVNTNGNSGMAMGGTGDLLSGMIASFVAQGMSLLNAAKCGVYIHGYCGDICEREISKCGMTVSDMIEVLGAVMSQFEK